MLPFSHLFAGYAVGVLLVYFGVVEASIFSIAFLGIVSLLPDIDVIWLRELQKHHSSIFHTPFFWILVSLLVGVFDPEIGVTVFALSTVHILTDAITGRSGGVNLLYPASKKEFRVCKTMNKTGSLNPVNPDIDILRAHMVYYLEDRKLVAFEVLVNLAGLTSLIWIIMKL